MEKYVWKIELEIAVCRKKKTLWSYHTPFRMDTDLRVWLLLRWDADGCTLLSFSQTPALSSFSHLAAYVTGTTGTLLPPAELFKFLIQSRSTALCRRQCLTNVNFCTHDTTCFLSMFHQLKRRGHVQGEPTRLLPDACSLSLLLARSGCLLTALAYCLRYLSTVGTCSLTTEWLGKNNKSFLSFFFFFSFFPLIIRLSVNFPQRVCLRNWAKTKVFWTWDCLTSA